jgi:hypothetical protein
LKISWLKISIYIDIPKRFFILNGVPKFNYNKVGLNRVTHDRKRDGE